MKFSVIIPTLNEEPYIRSCLRRVSDIIPTNGPAVETIVADGGSQDRTLDIARQYGATIVQARRGRGTQCNDGAAQASGDILLFLYADALLPHQAFSLINEFFADEEVRIGTFRLQFDMQHWLLDPAPFVTSLDSVYTKFGDQCIIIRRSLFDEVGGFPDWPFFEDVRLFERVRFKTCIYSLPAPIISSARKYRQKGVLANHLSNIWLIMQYLLGASPHDLARKYWKHQ